MEIINLESILTPETKQSIHDDIKKTLQWGRYDIFFGQVFQKPNRQDKNRGTNVVINIICDFYQVKFIDVISESRKREILHIRQLMQYLLRKYTELGMEAIAGITGRDTHATVVNAIKEVQKRISVPAYGTEVDKIEQQILIVLKLD